MATKKADKTFKIGRNAINGRFTTVEDAKRRPATNTVETVPKPTKKK